MSRVIDIITEEINEFARRNPRVYKHNGKEYARDREMNDETYALRRKAMEYIYEARNLVRKHLGAEQPRITIRVVDWSPERVILQDALACATGYGTNQILIPKSTFSRSYSLRHIVFHEILHAVYCVKHDNSILMSPIISREDNEDVITNEFIEHVKNSPFYKVALKKV